MITSDILSGRDETLGSAVQSGLKRTRSWRVPPNWSRSDWLEELAAVATAAAWQALCDFDPDRGVPLAGFGHSRIMSRCLARYRKEWRYALHLVASDSREEGTTILKDPGASVAKVNGTYHSSGDLRGAVGALPAEQQRLIEQLFWEERTETEVANTMHINQSTINRRKRTILKSLRRKLCDGNKFHKFRETAEALFRDPKLIDLCRHASRDRVLRAKILSDPIELLRSREMDIPPELTIEFFEPPARNLPISDWVPFILELTTCRTVWVRECDDGVPRTCTLKNETLCLGFRLYPNPVQPGPVG